MTASLYQFESMLAARTRDELAGALARQCEQLGYSSHFYSSLLGAEQGRVRLLKAGGEILDREQLRELNAFTSYPASWLLRYQEAGHERVDPVVQQIATSSLPVFWDGLKGVVPRHIVFDEAREHGLANGITVPVAGMGGARALFSIATDRAPEASAGHQAAMAGQALLTALYMHEAASRLAGAADAASLPALTAREVECLQWAATGKTSWEISNILSVSERTVIFHMVNATKKLKASNRRQAVVRALSLGLIHP